MKKLSILFVFVFSTLTMANDFNYTCRYQKEFSEIFKLSINKKNMIIYNQYHDGSMGQKKGKVVYDNTGLVGGNGQMKDRYGFKINYELSEVTPVEGFNEFFVTTPMTIGGEPLANGTTGGQITFKGHGYSYESYDCFLRTGTADDLVGTYVSPKANKSEARIEKVLVKQATLFEPAVYEYHMQILKNSYVEDLPNIEKQWGDYVVLKVSEDGKSLTGRFDDECDDPDCYYFEEVEVSILFSKKDLPYVKVKSYGWKLEGEEEEQEFESEYVFFLK